VQKRSRGTSGLKQQASRECRNVGEVKQQKGWKAAVVTGLCKVRVVSSVACARVKNEGADAVALVKVVLVFAVCYTSGVFRFFTFAVCDLLWVYVMYDSVNYCEWSIVKTVPLCSRLFVFTR
jgi:hypothetical protein